MSTTTYRCTYCKRTFDAKSHPVYKFTICPHCLEQAFEVEPKQNAQQEACHV